MRLLRDSFCSFVDRGDSPGSVLNDLPMGGRASTVYYFPCFSSARKESRIVQLSKGTAIHVKWVETHRCPFAANLLPKSPRNPPATSAMLRMGMRVTRHPRMGAVEPGAPGLAFETWVSADATNVNLKAPVSLT
jgi:hypothetical protein